MPKELAERAYRTYSVLCEDDLPPWRDLPAAQQDAWREVVGEIEEALLAEGGFQVWPRYVT
jgi:hypothetical protein